MKIMSKLSGEQSSCPVMWWELFDPSVKGSGISLTIQRPLWSLFNLQPSSTHNKALFPEQKDVFQVQCVTVSYGDGFI
uniref:Uncharacterized protein n=1 Tax=Anguilla anguilla TaxID=7936 RepID=A0A0E9X4N0_ANGAN